MKVILPSGSLERDVIGRLERMDIPVGFAKVEELDDLRLGKEESVYCIPIEVTQGETWAEWRVHLAQGHWLYVVIGQGLNTESIVLATRDGAYEVLDLEDEEKRWQRALRKVVESQRLWLELYGAGGGEGEDLLIGESQGIRSLRTAINRLGPTDAKVLVVGESGVGKERVAQALHLASGRHPFVALNCSAIPQELLESELFGVEQGAFTGASRSRKGLVEQARGGTLFLDEIGEMSLKLQPKLLRFLETKLARRVGGNDEYPADLRFLAATNRNLDLDIQEGTFRADLFYRFSEMTLRVPPLRTRKEDIPLFVSHFLRISSERFGKHFPQIEPKLIGKFQNYDWPGNVRELKSTIDRLVILYDGPMMRETWWEVPERSVARESWSVSSKLQGMGRSEKGENEGEVFRRMPSQQEKYRLARKFLRDEGKSLLEVSNFLGIHPTTLYRWRKQGLV